MQVSDTKKSNRHLLLGFALVLLIMGVVTAASLIHIGTLNQYIAQLIIETSLKSDQVFEMRDAMRQRQLRLRDMFISNDRLDREEIWEQHTLAASRFMMARLRLIELGLSEAEKKAMERLTVGASSGSIDQQEMIDAIKEGGSAKIIADKLPEAIQAQNQAFAGMKLLIEIQREQVESQLGFARQRFRNTIWIAMILTGIGLLSGVLISILVLRREAGLAVQLADYQGSLEKKVKERTEKLEVANRELEAYSHSLAHDLQTPLRAVTGFSQILQENSQEKLNSEDKDALQRVITAGKFMATLLDNLLILTSISRIAPVFERVDLSQLAKIAFEHISRRYPEVEAEVIISEGIVAPVDRKLLLLAMECLFDNAFKAVRYRKHPEIRFGVTLRSQRSVYYIQDNGIGFDSRYAENLFAKFQRLHAPGEFGGTGVGLATVQRILRLHRGKIWAEAAQGEGAVFYFSLNETSDDGETRLD